MLNAEKGIKEAHKTKEKTFDGEDAVLAVRPLKNDVTNPLRLPVTTSVKFLSSCLTRTWA